MATVRHTFVSPKDDPADTSVIGASKWSGDEAHELVDVASQTDLDSEVGARAHALGDAIADAEVYADTQDAAHVDDPDAHPYQALSERGVPTGYATLDASGQVPGSQLAEISVDGGLVGFYGVTPIARVAMGTGTGKTVDNIITALQNLGLFIQTGGAGGSGGLFDTGVFDTATFGVS